jgi:two-component system sensor histidine kinase RegB
MPALGYAQHHPHRNVRLDTLVRLRWLAIIGQTTAVLVVYYGLEFELPVYACLSVIALAAWLNVALRLRFHITQRLEPDRAAWLLAFDIAELAVLLFLTGGLQNPFAFLFLGPVLLSATALPPRFTLILGGFAVVCSTVLVFVHYPLPWDIDDPLQLPPIYMMGVWLCILLAIGFIGVYAWQITEESRQLSDALAATELVLTREQHLSQLDGLAAAAAHELGTPLSTISVIAKELERAIAPNARTVTTCGSCVSKRLAAGTSWQKSPNYPRAAAASPSTACDSPH